MKISKRITAAAVSSLMAAMSTAGTMTFAAENNNLNVSLGSYTLAANEVETKIYDAKAQLTMGEASVVAGDTVSVPVYLSIPDNDFITGIAFKAVYDKSALELTSITEPADPAVSDGKVSVSEENGIFCYTWTTGDITVDKSKPICNYNFKVKDTASGNYTIKLVNHLSGDDSKPIEIVHTQEPHKKNTYFEPTVTNGKINVSTTAHSEDVSKTYEGTAYIMVDKDISAAPGEPVEVPVYMELGSDVEGKYISGVGFMVSHSSDLSLVSIECPADCGLNGGDEDVNVAKGIFCYKTSNANITVDPSKPVCILKFIPNYGAEGRYTINLVNHLTGDTSRPVEVIHRTGKFPSTFLKPTVSAGWINVEDDDEDDPKKNDPTKNDTPTSPKDEKPTGPIDYDLLYWGDVNLDEYVDLADVTTLSKYLLSSKSYPLVNSTAWENADCKYDQKINSSDLSKLIEYNLRKITLDDLGPTDPALRRKSKRYN